MKIIVKCNVDVVKLVRILKKIIEKYNIYCCRMDVETETSFVLNLNTTLNLYQNK